MEQQRQQRNNSNISRSSNRKQQTPDGRTLADDDADNEVEDDEAEDEDAAAGGEEVPKTGCLGEENASQKCATRVGGCADADTDNEVEDDEAEEKGAAAVEGRSVEPLRLWIRVSGDSKVELCSHPFWYFLPGGEQIRPLARARFRLNSATEVNHRGA